LKSYCSTFLTPPIGAPPLQQRKKQHIQLYSIIQNNIITHGGKIQYPTMWRAQQNMFSSHLTATESASHKRIKSCLFEGFVVFSSFQKLCQTPSAPLHSSATLLSRTSDALAAATYILQARSHVLLSLPLRLRLPLIMVGSLLAFFGRLLSLLRSLYGRRRGCGEEEELPFSTSALRRSEAKPKNVRRYHYSAFLFIL